MTANITPAFVPNADQAQFFQDFLKFLLDPLQKEYRLTGAGGTGKTASMMQVINVVFPKYQEACEMLGVPAIYETVSLTATTNKAAEVLADQTGLPCQTIHSLLGLKVSVSSGSRESKLTLKRDADFIYNRLIVVDEASMLCPTGKQFVTDRTVNCKILYVGDSYQLQPVGHNYSPVYSGPGPTSELTISERNKFSPDLQALCAQLRQTIQDLENGKPYAFKDIQTVPGVIDWLTDDQMEQEFGAVFSQPPGSLPDDHRIIGFRNSRVREYNDYARQLRGLPSYFVDGEVLVNNRVVELPGITIQTDKTVTLSDVEPVREISLPYDCKLMVQKATLTWRGGQQVLDVPIDGEHLNECIKYIGKMCAEAGNFSDYHRVKAIYPDLRQKDALTGHKSQGSSYDIVFIDATDLSKCHQPETFIRLLYVGVSRARKRVVFYGQFAPKYGQIR